MPTNEPQPWPNDPALKEALDAFDGAKLPRPPITKLSGLTPAKGLEVLRTLESYLDRVGDPVVAVVRIVLADLLKQSFGRIEQTREFIATVQSNLDRTGYAVVCPSCSETGKLDVVMKSHLPTGSIRVKHGGATTHGGGSKIAEYDVKRVSRDPRSGGTHLSRSFPARVVLPPRPSPGRIVV